MNAGERLAAAMMFVILFPILVVIAATIYLLSGQAPLVGDLRVGQYGKPFWMLKFRTMWPKTGRHLRWAGWIQYLEPGPPRTIKSIADPRITSALAAFCRRHSLDELPQLWHVIQGRMSYVGPRPLTADELNRHYGQDAVEVLAKRPGLTGLWQVTGRSRLTYQQRRRMDLRLVRNPSSLLYMAILWRTVLGVMRGTSAW
jgi:exopolysaccharide production protein ExoY